MKDAGRQLRTQWVIYQSLPVIRLRVYSSVQMRRCTADASAQRCCALTPTTAYDSTCRDSSRTCEQARVGPDQRAPPPRLSPFEYRYLTEFQSHEPEFDYLKSLEIEEKINQVLLSTTLPDGRDARRLPRAAGCKLTDPSDRSIQL